MEKKEELAEVFKSQVCANCRKPISKRRLKKAIKKKWLPLCEPCDKFIKKQLEECLPLMQKVFAGKK